MMDEAELAENLAKALNQKEASKQIKKMAKAIIDEVKIGSVNITPGGVTGTAPSSGGPLPDGAASDGKITLLVSTRLAQELASSMDQSSATDEVKKLAQAITSHIMNEGSVSFTAGGITGVCSNSATSPGALTGQGSKGMINKLDDSALASEMAKAFGGKKTPQLKKQAKAIVDHIKLNSEVSFASGTVVGTISAGGGPIIAGAATGGTIS